MSARPTAPLAAAALALAVVLLPRLEAQNPPRIGYAYPAGGLQGATVKFTVGGQFLDGVTNVYCSGTGVQARVTAHTKPLTQNQINALREQLKELQDRKIAAQRSTPAATRTNKPPAAVPPRDSAPAWSAADEQRLGQLRQQLARAQRRPLNPGLAEKVTIEATLTDDAPAGTRELRLGTPQGLSNPIRFCIGQLPEFLEPASSDDSANPLQPDRRPLASPNPSRQPPALTVTPPCALNGQILPGDRDQYRFTCRRGQHLVAVTQARALTPYLADAVPGWFQAAVVLYDTEGKEIAYADDYRFQPDPILHCVIPRDGQYVLEVRDALFRGREDFVYRITLGALPFVTSVFPLGAQVGASTPLRLAGWNLPATTLAAETTHPGIHPLAFSRTNILPNPVWFATHPLPSQTEHEPNHPLSSAQVIQPGVILDGLVDPAGDVDVFQFAGQAGERRVAEVLARHLGSPLDSILTLLDAQGQIVANNDDQEDPGDGLTTHHADSRLEFTLPSTGVFYLRLADAQNKGGTDYAYRLRFSPPTPDFELRIVPSTLTARPGAILPLTAYALRRDGFTNAIDLVLADAPPGFSLGGARIPPGVDEVRFTLSFPPSPLEEPVALQVEGQAAIVGHPETLRRPAVPADRLMQAFAYHHLVPAQQFMAATSGRFTGRPTPVLLTPAPVRIPIGGTADVRIGFPTRRTITNVLDFDLSEPPAGITLQSVTPVRGGASLTLAADRAQAKAGQQGNLILSAFVPASTPPASAPGRPRSPLRRTAAGNLPAIPFEIVAPDANPRLPE